MRHALGVVGVVVVGALGCVADAQVVGLNASIGFSVLVNGPGGSAFLASGVVSISDGVGSASFDSVSPGLLSGGTVDVTVSDVNPFSRALRVVIRSDDEINGFVGPAALAGGQPITDLAFGAGMSVSGDFPGAPDTPLFDPAFAGLISSTGNIFDVAGNPFVSPPGVGLFPTVYPDNTIGGRVFYFFTNSSGDPSGEPINNAQLGVFDSTITYAIPSPMSAAVLVMVGVAAVRRRRC